MNKFLQLMYFTVSKSIVNNKHINIVKIIFVCVLINIIFLCINIQNIFVYIGLI